MSVDEELHEHAEHAKDPAGRHVAFAERNLHVVEGAEVQFVAAPAPGPQDAEETTGFFTRLRRKLNRGSSWLTDGLATLLRGRRIDADRDEREPERRAGHRGPGTTHTPISLVHATLKPGAELVLPWSPESNALVYVLRNANKHARELGIKLALEWLDPLSSAVWFEGWAHRPVLSLAVRITSLPKTWLLSVGWKRHGLLRLEELPVAP